MDPARLPDPDILDREVARAPRLPMARFGARTLPAILAATAARRPHAVFLRFLDPALPAGAPPRELTFEGFRRLVARAAAFLREAGVRPGDRVLLLAENSPEWQGVALAAQLLRAEPAGLFASLDGEPARAIAQRVRPRVVYAGSAAQWAKLAPAAAELAAAGLAAVVQGGATPTGLPPGLRGSSLAAALGEDAPAVADAEFARLADEVTGDDPFLLLFTSGTTGRPKGVRLPQRAIAHAIDGGAVATARTERDVGLHFLPFAHVAGHDQFSLALAQGHGLVMAARKEDVERALSLGTTYVFSVPLLYERIRAGVLAKVDASPGPLPRLLRAAIEAGARVRVDGSTALGDRALAALADRLVGRKLRARLGRVTGLFSGGAPAGAALFRFYEGLGLPFVELYGMSETAGLISSNLFTGTRRAASAGLLSPDHEVRFEAGGELCVRGPLLMTGYLESEDEAGAWTADRYFRTGDVGRLDAEGFLRIEGRRKHLLVLSTGKKLSPEPIEQAIASTASLEGAVLVGEGRPFVSAVVFVAREELARLSTAGRDPAEALLPRVRAGLDAFSEYEKPKRLVVVPGAPADHPGFTTPTLKVRRDAVLAAVAPAVAAVYGEASARA